MTVSKRGSILERWFPRKEAEQKQSELETAAAELDAAGVKRKEVSEEKTADAEKALDLGQLADEILALAGSEGDPASKREQLVTVLGQLAAMGHEDVPAEEKPMSTGLMSFSEDTEKAIKSVVKLNDQLIDDVAEITKAQDEISAAQKELGTAIKALAELPKLITTLSDRVKAVEDQLAGRPRAASKAIETKLSPNEDLLKNVEKQALEVDPFYGKPMKPTGNS